ncbi:MAG: pseudouridine synthase [Gammaproteobacteria bacterium]|nr:MAG: pseudouridine synthase [Gammaproteobacteria bacterium]
MSNDVANALFDLEAQLRVLGLWQEQSPPLEALASTQPFCVDTLTLPQWLQFIFLPRMHALLDNELALPEACSVTPMAQEYFKGQEQTYTSLLLVLERLDYSISNA